MQIISSTKQSILTVEDWKLHAPPKRGAFHWQQGRSAYELANAWCGSGVVVIPQQLTSLLLSHQDTKNIILTSGTPEYRIKFDRFRGEPRNADLVVSAEDSCGNAAITIEAKADEPFGDYVSRKRADAMKSIAAGSKTNVVNRIDQLEAALFSGPIIEDDLRYQLLTAAAGTLAYAEQSSADRAILVIHEFHTTATKVKNRAKNQSDLNAFVSRISQGSIKAITPGVLVGPFRVPGGTFFPSPTALYIGKVV